MSLYLTIAASDRFWKTSFTAVCVCVDPPKIISYYPGQVIWADLLVHVCFGRYDAFWHIWCLIPQNQRGRLYVKCGLITVRYILIMIGRYMQECDIECSSGVVMWQGGGVAQEEISWCWGHRWGLLVRCWVPTACVRQPRLPGLTPTLEGH